MVQPENKSGTEEECKVEGNWWVVKQLEINKLGTFSLKLLWIAGNC